MSSSGHVPQSKEPSTTRRSFSNNAKFANTFTLLGSIAFGIGGRELWQIVCMQWRKNWELLWEKTWKSERNIVKLIECFLMYFIWLKLVGLRDNLRENKYTILDILPVLTGQTDLWYFFFVRFLPLANHAKIKDGRSIKWQSRWNPWSYIFIKQRALGTCFLCWKKK